MNTETKKKVLKDFKKSLEKQELNSSFFFVILKIIYINVTINTNKRGDMCGKHNGFSN